MKDDWLKVKRDRLWASIREQIEAEYADSHTKGMKWQNDFADIARDRGLFVDIGTGRADWLVNGSKVQCKHCDERKGGWSVAIDNMRPVHANDGERGYLRGEYDVMALRHRDEIYLIPADRLLKGNKLAPSIDIALFRDCIDHWGVFDASFVRPEDGHEQGLLMELSAK